MIGLIREVKCGTCSVPNCRIGSQNLPIWKGVVPKKDEMRKSELQDRKSAIERVYFGDRERNKASS
jgi:hypothetical protein